MRTVLTSSLVVILLIKFAVATKPKGAAQNKASLPPTPLPNEESKREFNAKFIMERQELKKQLERKKAVEAKDVTVDEETERKKSEEEKNGREMERKAIWHLKNILAEIVLTEGTYVDGITVFDNVFAKGKRWTGSKIGRSWDGKTLWENINAILGLEKSLLADFKASWLSKELVLAVKNCENTCVTLHSPDLVKIKFCKQACIASVWEPMTDEEMFRVLPIVLKALENYLNKWNEIIKQYVTYTLNKPNFNELYLANKDTDWTTIINSEQDRLQANGYRYPVSDVLIFPGQRLMKYPDFFKRLVEYQGPLEDTEQKLIQELQITVLYIIQKINKETDLHNIKNSKNCPKQLSEFGDLSMLDTFNYWVWDNEKQIRIKSERRVFLFKKALLIAVELSEDGFTRYSEFWKLGLGDFKVVEITDTLNWDDGQTFAFFTNMTNSANTIVIRVKGGDNIAWIRQIRKLQQENGDKTQTPEGDKANAWVIKHILVQEFLRTSKQKNPELKHLQLIYRGYVLNGEMTPSKTDNSSTEVTVRLADQFFGRTQDEFKYIMQSLKELLQDEEIQFIPTSSIMGAYDVQADKLQLPNVNSVENAKFQNLCGLALVEMNTAIWEMVLTFKNRTEYIDVPNLRKLTFTWKKKNAPTDVLEGGVLEVLGLFSSDKNNNLSIEIERVYRNRESNTITLSDINRRIVKFAKSRGYVGVVKVDCLRGSKCKQEGGEYQIDDTNLVYNRQQNVKLGMVKP